MRHKLVLNTEDCFGLNGGLYLLSQDTKALHDSGTGEAELRPTGLSPPGCKNIRQC